MGMSAAGRFQRVVALAFQLLTSLFNAFVATGWLRSKIFSVGGSSGIQRSRFEDNRNSKSLLEPFNLGLRPGNRGK